MWIRQMPENFYECPSFYHDSVMLWQNNNIYVMDNHLSAAWCWLQHCDPKKKYNFMHIDRHYDMLECFNDQDLQPLHENPRMSYDVFKNLKRKNGEEYLFRWDNYIMATYILQPDWFHTNIFITHNEGDIGKGWGHKAFPLQEKNPLYMDFWITQYIKQPDKLMSVFKDEDYKLPWIINLDLDVFYIHSQNLQLYSDEYIRLIAKLLNECIEHIQVFTIALSPDCIGGQNMKEKWYNSLRILKIMSQELDCLKMFPFPQ